MPMRRQRGQKLLHGDLGPQTSIVHIEAAIASRCFEKDEKMEIVGIPKQFLGILHGFGLFRVDGEWIRNNLDVTFGTGGHGLVHTFIPMSEIWVDPVSENSYSIGFHEVLEFHSMLEEGMDYRSAHAKALKDQAFKKIDESNVERELEDILRRRNFRRYIYSGINKENSNGQGTLR